MTICAARTAALLIAMRSGSIIILCAIYIISLYTYLLNVDDIKKSIFGPKKERKTLIISVNNLKHCIELECFSVILIIVQTTYDNKELDCILPSLQ